MKKFIMFMLGVFIIIGAVVYLYSKNKDFSSSVASNVFKNSNFEFKYPLNWYPHHPGGKNVVLLKTKEYPNIESEIYALGEQILVTELSLIGAYEKKLSPQEYIDMVSTEENFYEGKPTLIKSEYINGTDMLRIERVNKDMPMTLAYYIVRGEKLYMLYLYPFRKESMNDDQNYKDFMGVVTSMKFSN